MCRDEDRRLGRHRKGGCQDSIEAAAAGARGRCRRAIDVASIVTADGDEAIKLFAARPRTSPQPRFAQGVAHHVGISVLGSERLADSGYIQGKLRQKEVVRSARVPYTLVRAAQFFELVPMMVAFKKVEGTASLPDVRFGPIASDDVADLLVEMAFANPDGSGFPINYRPDLAIAVV